MKKKRLKIKKKFKIIFYLIIFICIAIFAFIKIRQNYLYKQTYEYKLLQKEYSLNETKLLINNLDNKFLDTLLEQEKNEDLIKILKNKFYKKNNLNRYLDYYKNNSKKEINDIITSVNANLDYDFYETLYTSDTNLDYEILVNKFYLLKSDYEPNDLVNISQEYCWGTGRTIREEAYNAFIKMHDAALEAGYQLMINSAYRSYQDQEGVYKDYEEFKGTEYADSIAARPGASEHQTGLALDIFEIHNSKTATFKDSETYLWLKEHSYEYGFILRYPENKENITGYNFEAWHYRYLGKDLAKKVYDSGLTYDEYYANYIN